MKRHRFKFGDWNVQCDRTGFKLKASECRMTWDNLFVWEKAWSPRQPQDFVTVVSDKQTVPISRPVQDKFV